jgi:hypothetical protein
VGICVVDVVAASRQLASDPLASKRRMPYIKTLGMRTTLGGYQRLPLFVEGQTRSVRDQVRSSSVNTIGDTDPD